MLTHRVHRAWKFQIADALQFLWTTRAMLCTGDPYQIQPLLSMLDNHIIDHNSASFLSLMVIAEAHLELLPVVQFLSCGHRAEYCVVCHECWLHHNWIPICCICTIF